MTPRRWRLGVACILGAGLLLHWPVGTRQGIDYTVTEHRIPLYAKITHFLDRAITFKQLAQDITRGQKTEQAKAEAIVIWMDRLYRGVPDGLPVVDDHVLNVVIRGYGTDDQLAELFAVLCGYARMPATRLILRVSQEPLKRMDVAAVKIDGAWRFIDPFHRIAPKDAAGRWMTVESLQRDPAPAVAAAGGLTVKGLPYERYLRQLRPVDERMGLSSWKQRPVMRLWFELQRLGQAQ